MHGWHVSRASLLNLLRTFIPHQHHAVKHSLKASVKTRDTCIREKMIHYRKSSALRGWWIIHIGKLCQCCHIVLCQMVALLYGLDYMDLVLMLLCPMRFSELKKYRSDWMILQQTPRDSSHELFPALTESYIGILNYTLSFTLHQVPR